MFCLSLNCHGYPKSTENDYVVTNDKDCLVKQLNEALSNLTISSDTDQSLLKNFYSNLGHIGRSLMIDKDKWS